MNEKVVKQKCKCLKTYFLIGIKTHTKVKKDRKEKKQDTFLLFKRSKVKLEVEKK